MELAFLGNSLLFLMAFAVQFGAFNGSSTDDDDLAPPDSNYDPALYSDEIQGTDGADDFTAETDNLAWFLDGGDDSLDASEGDDYASGGTGDDHLLMREGDDIAEGGDGADYIDGGTGNDLVNGDAGNDSVIGNQGNDRLFGGDGDDTVLGGSDADILYGGAGNDYVSGLGQNVATGSRDTAIDGNDLMYGGDGDDTLLFGQGDTGYGGDGSDSFIMDYTHPEFDGVANIQDFSQATDTFELHYVPGTDSDGNAVDPLIEVTRNADGLGSSVSFDGSVVAHISGGQDLTADQIKLVAMGDS